jgi:antitoxin MazE
MIISLSKWGNSHAIRLPKELMEKAELSVNDKIVVSVNGRKIVLKKLEKSHSAKLVQRFQNYDGDYTCQELESVVDVGKEVF